MKKLIRVLVIGILVLFPIEVMAHPGRTDANGGHTCKTNCTSWGLEDGEYHKHNGGTYTNSKGDTYNSDGTKMNSGTSNNSNNNGSNNSGSNNTITTPKSNITTITTVKVNYENIEILDVMNYTTKSKIANVEVIATNSKATVDYNKTIDLNVGSNEVTIKVTAEDGTKKEYKLIITREEEKILSNKTGITVTINGQNVVFDYLKKGDKISIDAKENLDIQYTLEDVVATTDLKYDKEIKQGETAIIKFTVTAGNGDTQDYEVEVYRYTTTEETITTVIGIGVLGGLGYGGYRVVKKIKKKKQNTVN